MIVCFLFVISHCTFNSTQGTESLSESVASSGEPRNVTNVGGKKEGIISTLGHFCLRSSLTTYSRLYVERFIRLSTICLCNVQSAPIDAADASFFFHLILMHLAIDDCILKPSSIDTIFN